jgi:hypothetical protein
MSDIEKASLLADAGRLHGLLATASAKLAGWSDRIVEVQGVLNPTHDAQRAVFLAIDSVACQMREFEQEVSNALGITSLAGEWAEHQQTLDEFADEWTGETGVVVANPYPLPESAQQMLPQYTNGYEPSGDPTLVAIPENINSIGEPITPFVNMSPALRDALDAPHYVEDCPDYRLCQAHYDDVYWTKR